MRSPRLAALIFAFALTFGATAFAQARQVQQYQAPGEVDQAAIAAAKERARTGGINDYGKDVSAEAEPVPWLLIALVTIIFAGVAPFAWRAYKSTAAEVAATSPRSGARVGRGED